MIQFPAAVAHRGRESRSAVLRFLPEGTADRLAPMRWWLLAALFAALLWPHSAHADRYAGVGVGLRGGRGSDSRWSYTPVLIPLNLQFREYAAFGARLEVASGYLAFRPGVALFLCTPRARQCAILEGSVGPASASFGAPERGLVLLTGVTAAYQLRLGSTPYAARVDGEMVFLRRGEPIPGWTSGMGASLYVVRVF